MKLHVIKYLIGALTAENILPGPAKKVILSARGTSLRLSEIFGPRP
jgi:hypothetical protein